MILVFVPDDVNKEYIKNSDDKQAERVRVEIAVNLVNHKQSHGIQGQEIYPNFLFIQPDDEQDIEKPMEKQISGSEKLRGNLVALRNIKSISSAAADEFPMVIFLTIVKRVESFCLYVLGRFQR